MRLARRLRGERSDTSLTISQIAALSTLERTGPLTPASWPPPSACSRRR
jgi:hypothetical protein